MPTTSFIGKDIVDTLHLSTPYRPLVIQKDKSLGEIKPLKDSNLIIHGDNLAGLKALLPTHAGKIDCIYGDPPYNTGNDGWRYNDNVSSPLLKHWFEETGIADEFKGKVVDKDDPERHDKWMAMMWPRLQIMHELLSDKGVIFLSIDDDEHHMLRAMCDEIFERKNFVASIVWKKKYSAAADATWFSDMHDYIVCYAKNKSIWKPNGLPRTEKQDGNYSNPDNDPRGPWTSGDLSVKTKSDSGIYEITSPKGAKYMPPRGSAWRVSKEGFQKLLEEDRIYWSKGGAGRPRLKRFLSDVKGTLVPETFWHYDEVGHTDGARKAIKSIFPEADDPFETPKPLALIERIVMIATQTNSIVLDPFGGSGTTGHAVLSQNKTDNGDRKFILLECEDYADEITAERMRRVIDGVKDMKDPRFSEGFEGESFLFAELGGPIDGGSLLSSTPPARDDVARFILHSATGQSIDKLPEPNTTGFIGEILGRRYHLLYEADPKVLRSNDLAFTREKLNAILAQRPSHFAGETIVFAPCCFIAKQELSKPENNIRFVSLPFDMLGL